MTKDIHKILLYCLIAVSLLLLGAIYIWAPVCNGFLELANGNMVPMRCLYTAKAATVLSILLLVLAVASLLTKKSNPVMVIALGIMLIAVTYESFLGIGVCKKVMACHDTAFWLRSGGILTIILGLVSALKKPKQIS